MPKPEKEKLVDEIAEQLKKSKGIYLTDFTGLSVEEITELRANFRKEGVEYRVVKNSLTRLSAKKVGLDILLEHLNGPTALALGVEDSIAPAKIVVDFAKKLEKPKIRLGIVEGEVIPPEEIDAIVKIPSRDVLVGKVVGSLASPLSGLVGGLNGLLVSLVNTLNAVKENKERAE